MVNIRVFLLDQGVADPCHIAGVLFVNTMTDRDDEM
jgi:hypothetical protein